MKGIVLESVSKTFRKRPRLFPSFGAKNTAATCALRDINVAFHSGSIVVLLGPNGSGKTTLLRLISTMLLPDDGRVLVEGLDTRSCCQRVREQVGFAVASERSFFPRLTAAENLQFFSSFEEIPRKDRAERIEAVLNEAQLSDASDMLVMNFSSGMYQRLAIARALLKRPTIVLLDEPTRSLDPASRSSFWELIRELPGRGATVVVASHSFSEAEAIADFVAFLNQGELTDFRSAFGINASELSSLYFHVNKLDAEPCDLTVELCG